MKKLLIMAAAALASAFAASAVEVHDYLDRTGWTVTTCGYNAEGPNEKMLDDDLSTYWHQQWASDGNAYHWFMLDMQSEVELNGVDYWRRQGNQNGQFYEGKFYVSDTAFPSFSDHTAANTYYDNTDNTAAGSFNWTYLSDADGVRRCEFDDTQSGRYLLCIIKNAGTAQSKIHACCAEIKPWKAKEASEYYLPAVALKERGDIVAQIVGNSKQTAWNTAAADVNEQISETQFASLKEAFKTLVNGTHLKFQSKKANTDWVSLNADGTAPYRWINGEDSRVWTLEAADDASGFRILNEYAHQYITFPSQTGQASALTSDKDAASLYIIDVWKTTDTNGTLYGVKRTASGLASDRQYWHSNQTNDLICWQADDNSSWWIEVADDGLAVTQNLKGAIAGCGTTNGRTVGTDLGQYTRTGDFSTQLAAANEKLASGTTDEKLAAATALRTAQAACTYALNMPAPGKFYRLQHTNANKWATSQSNGSGRINMVQNGKNNPNAIWYLTDDNKLVSLANGLVLGKFAKDDNGEEGSWQCVLSTDEKAATVSFSAGQTIGQYVISPSSGRNIFNGNATVDCGDATDGNYCWRITEATWIPVALPADVETGHYVPFYSPVPLYKTSANNGTGTQRVKAHIGSISDSYVVKSELSEDIIPANTPVMIEYITDIESGSVFLQVAPQPEAGIITLADDDNTSSLSGSIYATAKADTHSYFTVANGDTPKFAAHSEDETYIPGFTAHIAVETANAPANGYTIVSEVPTAIETVDAPAKGNDTWYDLQGRRVARPAHGIFINAQGKKISL